MYRPGYFHHAPPEFGPGGALPTKAASRSEPWLRRSLSALAREFRAALDNGQIAVALAAGTPTAALVMADLEALHRQPPPPEH